MLSSVPRPLAVVVAIALASGLGVGAAACSGGSGSSAARPSTTTTTRPDPTTPCDPALGRRALDVPYVRRPGTPASSTSLDVYTPSKGCPAPVVMWVHGGAWSNGDKGFQIAAKARAFNDAGYVLVSVNYRLLDPAHPTRNRYPAFDDDVAASVAWVRRNIARYGGDPDRIALVGHSAGAGIAAAVATDPRYLAREGLALDALRCAAPLDTEAFDVAAQEGDPVYEAAFGIDPNVWAAASPTRQVAPWRSTPAFLLVSRGTADRRDGVDAFAAALRRAGAAVTVVDARGLSHDQVNARIGQFGDAVITPPLLQFLQGCFAA
jgi:acetyl esterase/lipase